MKTKKPSRILSLVLSAVMVLAMLPAVSGTAGAAAIVTRTTPLDLRTDANITYIAADGSTQKTANPTAVSIQDTGEGWSWDFPNKTLTLSGANIDCSGNAAADLMLFGIMLHTNCHIVLTEGTTSTVKAGDSTTQQSHGVYFSDVDNAAICSISGKGTLNAVGGGSGLGAGCAGIRCTNGKIIIREATIHASSIKSAKASGIEGNLDIKSGTITAHGTGADGYGLRTSMTMSGGTVTATGAVYGIGGSTLDMTGGTLSASGGRYAIDMFMFGIADATVTGANEKIQNGVRNPPPLTQSGADPVIINVIPPPATLKAEYDVVNSTGSGSRLERSFNVDAADNTSGITSADKTTGNSVTLKLTVTEKAAADTTDKDKVEGVRQGDSVQYYDVKVEKIVTTSDGTPTTTVLTSIPKPVQAVIPVPAGIQGKTSYTVYRVHNNLAEKIPNDPTAAEFYTVNAGGTNLTLNVRQFSTYAVITNNKSLTGDHTFGDATNPKNSAVDVQGKVIEGNFGVYKLDISWGAMKFDYNAQGKVWNPDTHVYEATGTKGWIKESFEAGNNKITVANHSNGDVWLSYIAKPDAVLAGTTMTVRSTNSLASVEAKDILLAKVATESDMKAPTVDAFVWLTGDPTSFTNKTYTKAGVITITAEPDKTGTLTPKKTP